MNTKRNIKTNTIKDCVSEEKYKHVLVQRGKHDRK